MSTRFYVIATKNNVILSYSYVAYYQALTTATNLQNKGYEVKIKRKYV